MHEDLLQNFHSTDPLELAKYGICPILAIVVENEPLNLLCRIVLPLLGLSLKQCSPILQHIKSLLHMIVILDEVRVRHGDRNICTLGSDSIQLVDFGDIASLCTNDIVAAGTLLNSLVKCMECSKKEKELVNGAAERLLDGKLIDTVKYLEKNE